MREYAEVHLPQLEIAAAIGIDVKTLRKHFSDELAAGPAIAKFEVLRNLYRKAKSSDPRNNNVAIFYAKARCGWKEADRHEIVGPSGGPVPVQLYLPKKEDA